VAVPVAVAAAEDVAEDVAEAEAAAWLPLRLWIRRSHPRGICCDVKCHK